MNLIRICQKLLNIKKNQALKDSIINKETYDKMAELQIKFDTAKKEKQILEQKTLKRKE
jgi:hypothetical protein